MTDEISYKDVEDFTPEHYQAIGNFVVHYSMLESFFHEAFSRYAGFPRETCRAIVGGMRLKDVIDRTKRVMKLNNADPKHITNFEAIESILNPISTFRDKLIHRVWMPSKDGPVIVNFSGAKSEAAITEEVITTEEIEKNSDKVLKLMITVIAHSLSDDEGKKVWRSILAAMPPKDRDLFLSMLPQKSPDTT